MIDNVDVLLDIIICVISIIDHNTKQCMHSSSYLQLVFYEYVK